MSSSDAQNPVIGSHAVPIEPSVVAQDRILQLDGLRTIAIFMVLVAHTLHVHLLWIGVDIFFVLSGFLITGILRARKERRQKYFSYFYIRRVFRILPPYVLTMALVAILFGTSGFWPWFTYVFFLMNMNDILWHAGGVPVPLWSLAVEEQFYIFWPFVVLLVSERTLLRIALAALIVVPILRAICTPVAAAYCVNAEPHLMIYNLTPFRADLLCAGAALAILWKNSKPAARDLLGRYGWIGVVGGFGILAMVQPFREFRLIYNTPWANAFDYSFSLIGSSSLLVWALANKGWWKRFLTLPPMRYVGRISYTIYLTGSIIRVELIKYLHSDYVVFLWLLVIATGWATVSWFFMEKPMMKIGVWLTGSGKVTPSRTISGASIA